VTKIEDIEIEDITDSAWVKRAGAAFSHWCKGSNGKIEARLFRIKTRSETSDIWRTKFLIKLSLACLEGVLANEISLGKELSSEEFILEFKSVAAFGGAYNSTRQNEKKLVANVWTSIVALMNKPQELNKDDIHKQMRAFHCYTFSASSKWFYHVAWDNAFVVFDPKEQVLAVLAVTDTD
jgi:hypothetical protein